MLHAVVLGSLLGCGGVPPESQPPAPAPTAAPASTLSAPTKTEMTTATSIQSSPPSIAPSPPFDVETTLNALVVVAGKPRCEQWTISPDASMPSKGTITAAWTTTDVSNRLELHYVIAGAELSFESYQHKVADDYAGWGTCGNTYAIAWDGSELAVDSARWFASPEACHDAIDTGRRVAMDSGDCGDSFRYGDDLREPLVGDDVRAKSLRRFKHLLRKGGKLYVADENDHGRMACRRVRVSKDGDEDGGEMSWIDPDMSEDGEPWRVTASIELLDEPFTQHHAARAEADGTFTPIEWSDPDYGVLYQEIFVSKGYDSLSGDEGFALGCGDTSRLWGIRDGVEISGNPHYFSHSACKRAIKREAARRRWFPTEDEDPDGVGTISAIHGPGIGGC
jgi:hypothetical protein